MTIVAVGDTLCDTDEESHSVGESEPLMEPVADKDEELEGDDDADADVDGEGDLVAPTVANVLDGDSVSEPDTDAHADGDPESDSLKDGDCVGLPDDETL